MVASLRRYTFNEYLDVEEISAVKHEYLNGSIYAMAGGTPEHAALSAAIVVLLGTRLSGQSCRPYSADLRIRVLETALATYADASVVCGALERDPTSPTHVTNPRVVIEVLSASTEDYDRGEKREHYQRIESLREYVLIAQDQRRVEVYARATATDAWARREYVADATVDLPSVGVTFSVNELYEAAGLT